MITMVKGSVLNTVDKVGSFQ